MRTPKPRYSVGDIVGSLTIVEYLGFKFHRRETVKEHLYRVRCKCGNEDKKTQNYLTRVTSKLMCKECTDAMKTITPPVKRKKVYIDNELLKLWKPIK